VTGKGECWLRVEMHLFAILEVQVAYNLYAYWRMALVHGQAKPTKSIALEVFQFI
jgi:hypothetical protein